MRTELSAAYDAEVVAEPLDKTGHFATACLVHMSGGMGGGTVDDEEESCETRLNGSCSLCANEASTEKRTVGRKETEHEATCDGKGNRTIARNTENSDFAGAYIGDLTAAVLL